MSAKPLRWYRWTVLRELYVPNHTGYEYATSVANVQAIVYERACSYDERVEERDVTVRAIKRPPLVWLRTEWASSMRAMNAAIDWHRFVAAECKARPPIYVRDLEALICDVEGLRADHTTPAPVSQREARLAILLERVLPTIDSEAEHLEGARYRAEAAELAAEIRVAIAAS